MKVDPWRRIPNDVCITRVPLPFVKPNCRKLALLSLAWMMGTGSAFFYSAPCQAVLAASEDRLEEGFRHLSQGRLEEALHAFTDFKQTAPQDFRPYFYSGIALTELGRLSAAASEILEAVRLAPDRAECRVFQANVLQKLKQREEAVRALEFFDEGARPEQLDTAWLRLLADVYFKLEKIDQTLRALDLLAQRDPRDARVDLDRGLVYVVVGKPNVALDHFKKSISKSKENPLAYFELGKILYQRNELDAAKQALSEAVRLREDHPEYLYKLGMVCLARGEVEEALGYLKQAEPAAGAFPEIYFALGRAYQRKGNQSTGNKYRRKFEEAMAAERKEKERMSLANRLLSRGETQLDRGNTAEARSLFEQAIQADPNRWEPHGYLAEMFLASGDLKLAYPHLVKMEEIDPDSAVGNFLAATYWYRLKDFGRARDYAEKVKRSRPGNSEVRGLLGKVYLELGQKEKALREFEAAARLAPDRAEFREQLERLQNQNAETAQTARDQ